METVATLTAVVTAVAWAMVEVPAAAVTAVAAAAAAGSAVAFGALVMPAALPVVAAAVSAASANIAFGVVHGRTSAAADTADTDDRGLVDMAQKRLFRLLNLYRP